MVQRKFPKINIALAFILIIAAFFRLYRISDYMEFLGDQGRDLVIVRDFLVHGNLFFIGPQTSIGNMYLGPFYYYLFVAPGLIISNFNPVGPAIIVALLSILTVYLIYRIATQWFNQLAGYIASLLYAISPVVIKYSNFSWNPNVMPLFSLLFVYFSIANNFVLATIAFIICLNSHFLALLLLPFGGLIFIHNYLEDKTKRSQLLRQLVISIVIFLISLLPQILFDIKHHGQNINAIIAFFTQRETTLNLKAYKAIPGLFPIFEQIITRLLAGKDIGFGHIVSIIFIFLLIYQISIQFRQRQFDQNFLWLLLWIFIGIVGLALYKQHIYDHYFGFLFPSIFIVFSYLIAKLPMPAIIISIAPLIYFSLVQNQLRWPPPNQLKSTSVIMSQIAKESDGKPFNFALLAKQNYDPPYRYIAYINNYPIRDLKEQMTNQLFVVCEPHPDIDCNPVNNPFWDIAAFGWVKIDKQWEFDGKKIYKLIHNQK